MRRWPLGQILTNRVSAKESSFDFSRIMSSLKMLLFNLDDEPGWVPFQAFLRADFHGSLSHPHDKVTAVKKGRLLGGHEAIMRWSSGPGLG